MVRVIVKLVIPIMQCPDCREETPGGGRRPGVDELREEFFFRCKSCGKKTFGKAIRWEAEVNDIGSI